MRKFAAFQMLPTTVAAVFFLMFSPVFANQSHSSGELLVSTAESMVFDGRSITLSGTGSEIIWFTDRPERETGTVPWSEFLDVWKNGRNSFESDPPNAVITLDGDVQSPIIVELSRPRLDGNKVTFDVVVLHGQLPASAGATSIVYDLCLSCAAI